MVQRNGVCRAVGVIGLACTLPGPLEAVSAAVRLDFACDRVVGSRYNRTYAPFLAFQFDACCAAAFAGLGRGEVGGKSELGNLVGSVLDRRYPHGDRGARRRQRANGGWLLGGSNDGMRLLAVRGSVLGCDSMTRKCGSLLPI